MPSIKPGLINNSQFRIQIEHLPTQEKISFDSWLTAFSDQFMSSWSGTPVYGRMDDLYTFTKTSRRLSMAFNVIAVDAQEAFKNQFLLNRLTQFLYPVYSEAVAGFTSPEAAATFANKRNSQVLQAAPLLRIKFNGLVQNSLDRSALVGFLDGFTYAPIIDQGQFFSTERESATSPNGAPEQKVKNLDMVYQNHQVSLNFTVLHTHLTGWVRKSTTDAATTYSFGSADTADLDNNYPHGGAARTFEEGEFQRLQDASFTQDQIWGGTTPQEQDNLAENTQAAVEEVWYGADEG
jgi:hypothetical protein